MSSVQRVQLEDWLKTLEISCDKVLDIGGSQNPVIKRVKSWNVDEYKILDLPTPHIERTKADIVWDINIDIDFCNHSGPHNLDSVNSKYIEYFNSVFMLEVLDYVWNPVIAVNNCNELLKSGGKLYGSIHFIYPFHEPFDSDYLRMTPNGMCRVLEETGFTDIQFIERKMSDVAFENYTSMVLRDGMRRCVDSCITGGMFVATKV